MIPRHRPAAEGASVLPFRRKGAPALRRRRRHPLLRLLRPFALAVAIVALPVASTLWLLTTPRLALHGVRVSGDPGLAPAAPPGQRAEVDPLRVRRVSEDWIAQAVAPLGGRNLLRLPLEAVRARVERHPWVRSVEVRKELPDRLAVRVLEHRPAALYQEADALLYVDASGRVIAPLAATDGAVDLVLISRPARPEPAADTPEGAAARRSELAGALALAGEVATVKRAWSDGLSEIEVLGARDFRLVTSELPFPLLVRAGTLSDRVRRLETLLPQITARYRAVRAVDLRFARRIIVQPSGHPDGTPSAPSVRS